MGFDIPRIVQLRRYHSTISLTVLSRCEVLHIDRDFLAELRSSNERGSSAVATRTEKNYSLTGDSDVEAGTVA
jgi:hypothetical protein